MDNIKVPKDMRASYEPYIPTSILKLKFVDLDGEKGKVFEFKLASDKTQEWTFGRDESNDVVLKNPAISSVHARLKYSYETAF